jgi:predicted  nucleic acid-binding Zn-ribbon protein
VAYSYDRPDLKALDDLEQTLRHLTDELAGWRRRSLRAEAELEAENQALRQRIEAARERLSGLAARLAFLEQHGGGTAA